MKWIIHLGMPTAYSFDIPVLSLEEYSYREHPIQKKLLIRRCDLVLTEAENIME